MTRSRRFGLAATALAFGGGLGAQSVATYYPLVVQLPVSVRSQGMGGAWTAGRDADAVFSNPANAGASGMNLGGSRFGSASSAGHAATGLSFGSTGLSLGVAWLDYGTPSGAPVPWRALGERGDDDGLSAQAVVAGTMTYRGIRWGGAARLLEERIANAHDGTIGFDIGAAREFGQISTGIAVLNIGRTLDVQGRKAFLPTRYSLGASAGSYPIGPLDVAAVAAADIRRDGRFSPAGGVELSYSWLDGYVVSFRAGARRFEAESLNPLTVGASFGLDRFVVDYALMDLRAPARGTIHSLALRVR
ncbi:MAG: hypothetical protein MNPFHGCM_01736 [Gemmatimonadaceae bacterium]|nr:hypothetical protein [Gemmatimonadaceae bacterium]